eukprot:tig00001331_g8171.t1
MLNFVAAFPSVRSGVGRVQAPFAAVCAAEPSRSRLRTAFAGRRFEATAVRTFTAAAFKRPSFVVRCSSSDDEAKKLAEEGIKFYSEGDVSSALMSFSKAIDLKPEPTELHVLYVNRAMCFAAFEQFKSAAQDALKAGKLAPDFGQAHFMAGDFSAEIKDFDNAYFSYLRARDADPEMEEIHERIAMVMQMFPNGPPPVPFEVKFKGGPESAGAGASSLGEELGDLPSEYADLMKDLKMDS